MINEFLDRESVALTDGQWGHLEKTVVNTASRALVGRRFIPVYGPLGAGVQTVPLTEFEGASSGAVDLSGETEADTIRTRGTRFIPVPLIHKDFQLEWRNVAATGTGLPLDPAPAAAAASYAARSEDELIFHGDRELGLDGLLTVEGRNVLPLGDWSEVGNAFEDVSKALTELANAGFFGPYALIVSPRHYSQMHGVHERTGVLEIRNVEELTTAGIFRSPAVPENRAIVVSVGAQNMDLAIAQDLVVGALGPENMNLLMRVFEAVVPRIKRPEAIVTLERAS